MLGGPAVMCRRAPEVVSWCAQLLLEFRWCGSRAPKRAGDSWVMSEFLPFFVLVVLYLFCLGAHSCFSSSTPSWCSGGAAVVHQNLQATLGSCRNLHPCLSCLLCTFFVLEDAGCTRGLSMSWHRMRWHRRYRYMITPRSNINVSPFMYSVEVGSVSRHCPDISRRQRAAPVGPFEYGLCRWNRAKPSHNVFFPAVYRRHWGRRTDENNRLSWEKVRAIAHRRRTHGHRTREIWHEAERDWHGVCHRVPGCMCVPPRCRQSHDHPDGLSYRQSIKAIIKKDGGGTRGALGVFGRGLGGRVAASALQVS